MKIRLVLPSLLSILPLLLAVSGARAQDKMLTLDDIYDPKARVNFSGSPVRDLRWLKDGAHYLQARAETGGAGVHWLKVDVATGQAELLFDAAKMEAALTVVKGVSPDAARRLSRSRQLLLSPDESGALLNAGEDLIYYQFGKDTATRVTSDGKAKSNQQFSPNGKMISFVRDNNLFVVDIATGRERALTTDGAPKILNGKLDWVYQEEVYGRGNFEGAWWSPDSSRIAFLRIDENPVHQFIVVDHIPYQQGIEDGPYPESGDPNPTIQLGIASVEGGPIHWADNGRYEGQEMLISRVAWSPNSKTLAYQVQDREQTWLDLNFASLEGKSAAVIKEKTKAWVEVIDDPHFLSDGSFLWMSERTGFRHIYHYNNVGRLLKQVTDGKWEARTLQGVDEAHGLVFFSGTERSPIGNDAYKIGLDGTGLARLTAAEATHQVRFNSDFSRFIDTWSDVNTPAKTALYGVDGTLIRVIDENSVTALKQYKLGKPEFMQVKTRDGFVMEAMMIKPPDFDPSKKYPVLTYVYSGPHSQTVVNRWGGDTTMWHQLLAQKGYIIWECDNRSASGKGVESTWTIYRNFGELELRDIEDGLTWLKSQPYVDGDRIGIWGWSFGGFMTSYSLTHSTSFKLGISGGTVADWRDYDTIYTERYMQTPQHNPEGYKKSGPRFAAANLHGKLLLIHGAIDDNVHVQNTMQLAYELQRAGKQFNLMLYPKSRHGVTDPLLVKQMRTMMTDFILQNL